MSWRLAIDFGTSSTSAAMARGALVEPVPVEGLPSILSNVFWHEPTHRLLLGEAADNAAAAAPWCFEPYPKRRLGDEFMRLGDERVRVTDAVGAILRRVADEATLLRGGERPGEVRLTHPVRWGATRKTKLCEAATTAGLPAAEMVPEPVAAATHYAAEALTSGQYVAVYDLGGGTLDTVVLCRTDDDFVVVGQPGGREDLGGEDFDERLYLFLGEQLPEDAWARMRTAPLDADSRAWARTNRELRRRARRAKELLSSNPQVDVYIPAPIERDLTVTAEQLNGMIRDDIEDSVGELDRTIHSAGLEPSQLAAVYLAGGSSRMPLVAHLIQEQLGVTPRHLDDPKAVVSLGAARGARAAPRRQASRAEPLEDNPQGDDRGTGPVWPRRPRIAGHPRVGERLTLTDLSVTGGPAELSYEWQRQASTGSPIVTITEARQAIYEARPEDAGWRVRANVTAHSPSGEAVESTGWTVPVVAAGVISRERVPSRGESGQRAAATVAAVGAVVSMASLGLHGLEDYSPWTPGIGTMASRTWSLHYPLGITAIGVALLGMLGWGIRSGRRGPRMIAAGLAFALLGESLPLAWGSQFGAVSGGFWLGVGGAAVAAIGTVILCWPTGTRAPTTDRIARSKSLSVRSRVTLVLLGPLILVISLFLNRKGGQDTWDKSTGKKVHWGQHYSIVLILVSGVIVAVAVLGIRFDRHRAAVVAALLACLVVGEAFPLFFGGYDSLQIGFWLGVVGAVVALVGLALVAASTRRDGAPPSTPDR